MAEPVPYPGVLNQSKLGIGTLHSTVLLGLTRDIMSSIRELKVVAMLQMRTSHKLSLLQSL